jgi:hypothetical protein
LTKTFDNKRQIKPLKLIDIDEAFFGWWDKKLNLFLNDDRGQAQKVPIVPLAPERWSLARESGIRNAEGTLALPIIVVARTGEGGPNEPGLNRIFADLKRDHVYYKQANVKSSLVKELIKSRPKNIDPALPIYEVYTHRAPDHYALNYTVDIWTPTVEDMNIVIEKIGQELDYKSVKSFIFETDDGFYFNAFQEDGLDDEGNLSDFTGKERIVRKTFKFKVPAYILPQSNQRRDTFKRYFSQTKLVFKQQYAMNKAEYEKFLADGTPNNQPTRRRSPSSLYAPYNSIAPTIAGTQFVGFELSSDVGLWGYTGTVSYTYQWRRNGDEIAGAVGSTYTLSDGDGGQLIDLVVTATNEIGSNSQSSNVLTISASAPDYLLIEDGDYLMTEDDQRIVI